jgi:hypothetical protein
MKKEELSIDSISENKHNENNDKIEAKSIIDIYIIVRNDIIDIYIIVRNDK